MNEIILQEENIRIIVQAAPQSFSDNRISRDRCVSFGQGILDTIRAEGMNDELDSRAAAFIDKARRTLRAMNERRSPVTKLFDEVRREFTALENDIDPSRPGTIPYELQQLRNRYAADKRAEEERRRQEELMRRQDEDCRRRYALDVEDDLCRQFRSFLDSRLARLTEIETTLTLDGYDTAMSQLADISRKVRTGLPAGWLEQTHPEVPVPVLHKSLINVSETEQAAKQKLAPRFREQYAAEVGDTADDIINRMPSLKANLQRIAQATEEEAARLKAETEERQRAEAARMERQRAELEAEERRKIELECKTAEMTSLFDGQAVQADVTTQAKVKVSKRIRLLVPEGILPVFSLWWSREGCRLTTDELARMFRKQITFCEKLADKEDVTIRDAGIAYEEEVKAR